MSQSAVVGKRLHASRTLPTREAWLLGLANALRPFYGRHKAALPARVRISVGWPSKSATTARTRRIGECWYSASDGVPQVFVSPLLADQLQVAAVLVHELVHAALGPGAGHGPAFRRVATRLGLAGPMRATHALPDLVAMLAQLVEVLGPYPHAALAAGGGPGRTAGTRMLKLTCPSCGYTVRTTRKWLDVGQPFCPDGDPLVELAK